MNIKSSTFPLGFRADAFQPGLIKHQTVVDDLDMQDVKLDIYVDR